MEHGDVVLRSWTVDDAERYAATVTGDQLIQRFTSESPTVTVDEVHAAIVELLTGPAGTSGFLIADAITDQRLGNIALTYDNGTGDVSYWIAARRVAGARRPDRQIKGQTWPTVAYVHRPPAQDG